MAWKEYSGDEHGYRDLIKKHHPDAKVGRGHADGVTQHTVGHRDTVVGHYDSHNKTGKVKVYESFNEFIAEDNHGSAQEHHAEAAAHKAQADSHEEGSQEYHAAMGKHHKSLMMAHRAEARSKRLIKDRTASVQAADGHFKKAMHHYSIASGVGQVKEGSAIMLKFGEILSEARKVDPRVKAYHEAAAKADEVSKSAFAHSAKGDHSPAAAEHHRAEGFHQIAANKAAGVDHQKRLYHTRQASEHKRAMQYHHDEHKKAKKE